MSFDREKYKVYTWKHGLMLHWVLNPGLAINELILGQRVPKVSLLDKTSNKPKMERSYVPCPHCDTLHDGRVWSLQNKTAFKNWFGLYCPSCGEIIPCLMNVFSFLILAITFPIWGWFKEDLKRKWLEKQPKRYENVDVTKVVNPFKGRGWIRTGLVWGLMMFVMMTFIFPLIDGREITMVDILIGVPVWAIGGLLFGYSMKYFSNKKGKENLKSSS